MFETDSSNKFESSDKYFYVIELLRISMEWILETNNDLQQLQAAVGQYLTALEQKDSLTGTGACAAVIGHNWAVSRAHKARKTDLLARINTKMQEVKSLRDGLSELACHVKVQKYSANPYASSSSTQHRYEKQPKALKSTNTYWSSL